MTVVCIYRVHGSYCMSQLDFNSSGRCTQKYCDLN